MHTLKDVFTACEAEIAIATEAGNDSCNMLDFLHHTLEEMIPENIGSLQEIRLMQKRLNSHSLFLDLP